MYFVFVSGLAALHLAIQENHEMTVKVLLQIKIGQMQISMHALHQNSTIVLEAIIQNINCCLNIYIYICMDEYLYQNGSRTIARSDTICIVI